jgi:predicted RNA-binding protein with EMAP domain
MSLEAKRINITSNIIYLSRMVRKVRKDKKMAKRNGNDQETSLRTIESAESVRHLIHSLKLSLEEKVEDQINELSHKSNCLLEIISSSNRNHRQKLFLAYRDFLERNIDVVNEKIDEL